MPRFILALSLNPAIDRTVTIPNFAPGATNRVNTGRLDPGGKGINVARVLHGLGSTVQVLGFVGEANGALHARCLAHLGLPAELIRVPGETRVNLKVLDPSTEQLTEINDLGFTVAIDNLTELMGRATALLTRSSLLLLSGSLPEGVPSTIYRDLVELAQAASVPVMLDADGDPLAQALGAKPTLIKPNRAEAERILGRPLQSKADLVQAAQELVAQGPRIVVISCGAEGAVLACADGTWWATPPSIKLGSAVGAGDAMVAGLAQSLSNGLAPALALRFATAAGSATASLPGTQLCSNAEVQALLDAVKVEKL